MCRRLQRKYSKPNFFSTPKLEKLQRWLLPSWMVSYAKAIGRGSLPLVGIPQKELEVFGKGWGCRGKGKNFFKSFSLVTQPNSPVYRPTGGNNTTMQGTTEKPRWKQPPLPSPCKKFWCNVLVKLQMLLYNRRTLLIFQF